MFLAIGTDIEEFVAKDGVIGSAIGLINGSKHEPRWCKYGNLQEDNVLAEYAINPCSSEPEFIEHVLGLRQELLAALPGYSLVTRSTHRYEREHLLSFGSNAMRFGCSAEYNAWSQDLWELCSRIPVFTQELVNSDLEDRYRSQAPSPYTELRTAGGHVHFSYLNPNDVQTLSIFRVMDYLLGTWSVLNDTDRSRRELYGKAGSCRIKPYGGEYRALSNFWIQSPEMISGVYKMTECAVQNHDKLLLLSTVCSGNDLQRMINEYSVPECSRVHLEVRGLLGLQI